MYIRALEITERVHGPGHSDMAIQLNNLASLYETIGRYAEAEPMCVRALEITERVHGPDHQDVAIRLHNLASLYETIGRYAEAEPVLIRALEITEKVHGPNHPDIAIWLNNLAGVYRKTGRYIEAEQLSLRALLIAEHSGDPHSLYRIQNGISQTHCQIGMHNVAILFGKQAVNTIQDLRANISKMGAEVLKSYQSTVEDVFKHLACLLIEEDRIAESEQVMNLLKEQEYFEYIRRDAGYADRLQKVSFTTFEASCDRMYQESATNLAMLSSDRDSIHNKERTTPEEVVRLSEIDKSLEMASEEFQRTLDRIKEKFARQVNRVEQIEEASGLMEDLRELGHGAVALYTMSTKETFHILLITSEYRKAFSTPIGEKKLRKMIADFRSALMNRSINPLPLAQELYKIILGPVVDELKNTKILMWNLEGPMRYIPLAALHDGDKYLVESYENVVFTPASNSRLKDDPKAIWKGLGLGVTEAHEPFPPLPEVERELKSIIRSQDNPKAVFDGTLRLNDEFNWEAMRNGLQKKYPLVHIASHFHCAPGNDTTSFLLLGDGQKLTIDKIRNQANLFGGVDLLTLSACDTAVGNVGQDGKEIESFGVFAQRQGAKAILATLWPVADVSTSILMKEFYTKRAAGKTKAAALQEAQIALLKGYIKNENDAIAGGTTNLQQSEIDENAPFAHPFFWAPFILIGNWK